MHNMIYSDQITIIFIFLCARFNEITIVKRKNK